MSYRRNYGGGQHQTGYYDSSSRNREPSSRSFDYITPPAQPRTDYISISVRPDHATYKIRLDNSDSGYAGSGSDSMSRHVPSKDDHILPYAHDQGFVSYHRCARESREAQHPARDIQSSASGSANGRHATERFPRHEKRSDGYDQDAHYTPDSEPARGFSHRTTRERRSVDRNAPHEEQSDYRIYTDGWGSKHNFKHSHGIKPGELDSYEEAGELLDKYRELDAQRTHEDRRPSGGFTTRTACGRRSSDYDAAFEEKSNYRTIKHGCRNSHTFKRSRGLKPTDADDYQEANELLHNYKDHDLHYTRDPRQESRQHSNPKHKRHDSHSHGYPQPHPHTHSAIPSNASDTSYQNPASPHPSTTSFSLPTPRFSPHPSPLRESIPHLPRYFPNPPHPGFAYTRAMRQHHGAAEPRYANTVPERSDSLPSTPSYRGRAYSAAGCAAAAQGMPCSSDDEFDGSSSGDVEGGSGILSASGRGSGVLSASGSGSGSGILSASASASEFLSPSPLHSPSGSHFLFSSDDSRSDLMGGLGYGSDYMSGDDDDDDDDDYNV